MRYRVRQHFPRQGIFKKIDREGGTDRLRVPYVCSGACEAARFPDSAQVAGLGGFIQ